MVLVPEVTPCTTPFVPTVATEVLVLLHTPPGSASLNVAVKLAHVADGPVIVPALGMTVTAAVMLAIHPTLLVTVSEGV